MRCSLNASGMQTLSSCYNSTAKEHSSVRKDGAVKIKYKIKLWRYKLWGWWNKKPWFKHPAIMRSLARVCLK